MIKRYLHPNIRKNGTTYNKQLIKWLILRGYISKNRNLRILDLGSGKGHFYFNFFNFKYNNVVAVDRFPEFKECKKGDITKKLPFKDNSFDLIISRDIAEHEKFFQEQYRVLKKGGKIIVMTPNAEKMKFGDFYSDYTYVMPYTWKSLKEGLEMNGFTNVKVTRLRGVPRLWKYTHRAFDILFSRKKNNLLGVRIKNSIYQTKEWIEVLD